MRGTRRDPRAHAILEYVSRESVEHPRQVPPAPPASLMACATLLFFTINEWCIKYFIPLRFGSSHEVPFTISQSVFIYLFGFERYRSVYYQSI